MTEQPFTGFNAHRLKENDEYHKDEVTFHKLANEKQMIRMWDMIIFGAETNALTHPKDYLSDRERQIVGGVIQWLGTPVGINFLRNAGFEKIDKEK